MASFWSDRLVEWIGSMTDVTEDIPSIPVETVQERAVEEGKAFITYSNKDALSAGTSQKIYLKTPVDKAVALSVSSVSLIETGVSPSKTISCRFYIYEGSTVSGVGNSTDIVTVNLNRNSIRANACTINNSPTVTSNGTMLTKGLILGGISTVRDSMLLKPNTVYILEVANISAVDALLSWNFITYQMEQ